MNRDKFISEPADFKLTETDFESKQDSTVLVRERTRGSKLEGADKKRKGALLEQTYHAISFLLCWKFSELEFYSELEYKTNNSLKKDIGRTEDKNQPCCSEADRRLLTSRSEEYKNEEQPRTARSEDRNETDESVKEIGSFRQDNQSR